MEILVLTLLWLGLVADNQPQEQEPVTVQQYVPVQENGRCFAGRATIPCTVTVGWVQTNEQN